MKETPLGAVGKVWTCTVVLKAALLPLVHKYSQSEPVKTTDVTPQAAVTDSRNPATLKVALPLPHSCSPRKCLIKLLAKRKTWNYWQSAMNLKVFTLLGMMDYTLLHL